MASSVPGSRALPESRYDLSSYWGRVKHCADVSDPRMLAVSSDDLARAKTLISMYRNTPGVPMTPELWRAKKVLDSTLHPDTGESVLLPFRMSCYVLSNLVVTAGMLTPNLSTAGTLFWQIANQSLNVAVNTANANKSHPLSTTQLVTSYLLAVGGSCGVALGLNSLVPRLRNLSPSTRTVLTRLVPFAAVVSAGIANVFLMRSEEIRRGINVYSTDSSDTAPLGTSRVAATYAVGQTAASRVLNATPIMALPPLILFRLQRGFLRGKSRFVETLTNLGIIAVTSFAVLPFALAAFPQRCELPVSKLEEKFHSLKDSNGQPATVWFNRGM